MSDKIAEIKDILAALFSGHPGLKLYVRKFNGPKRKLNRVVKMYDEIIALRQEAIEIMKKYDGLPQEKIPFRIKKKYYLLLFRALILERDATSLRAEALHESVALLEGQPVSKKRK